MLLRLALALSAPAAAAAQALPSAPAPPENPSTAAKVVLGKILFWDEQLASDDGVACGTCHAPEAGGADPRVAVHPGADGLFGTDDDVRASAGVAQKDAGGRFLLDPLFGVDPRVTGRVAGTVLGAALHAELFWDGRAGTRFLDPETGQVAIAIGGALEHQAVAPILSPVEMGHEGRTWQDVREKLQNAPPLRLARALPADVRAALAAHPTYPALFAAAFGDPAISAVRIAFALAAYQRTLLPDATPYDRFVLGDPTALTPTQQLGLQLFETTARCTACHVPPFFSDDTYHVLGLRPAREDPGRQHVTNVAIHAGAFKTPTLRNAGLRPRLFHNGSSPSLLDPGHAGDPRSVHNVYLDGGGIDRSNLDPFLLPIGSLGVTHADMAAILEFVRHGLTDPRAAQAAPPFDHPVLRSAVVPPPDRFGAALAGHGEPRIGDSVPTYLGNAGWRLGLLGGGGSSPAYLAWSLQAMQPAANWGGLPVHLVPPAGGQAFLLAGAPGGPGVATWSVPIPPDPVLRDMTLFLQLFVWDAASPVGIAASRGHGLTVRD